ncbi:hypothetical protein MKEN_01315900 [Mycena kentingensis (nom. inval.)]|nr:hypothetical protein MKEN_01315900 [Mycena kentingensis (nom. inval.)]
MHAQTQSLPFVLEDRTGAYTSTDFDDIYDRAFFHVVYAPQSSAVMLYSMNRRASRHRDAHWQPHLHTPAAVLEFAVDGGLGNVSFAPTPSSKGMVLPMARYLRKTSLFGRSLSRKFGCSDGREYKWVQQPRDALRGGTQEWVCTPAENDAYIVAHYDLKPADVRAYGVSGNSLTIYEASAHLTLEILASFIIMRHIQQYNL